MDHNDVTRDNTHTPEAEHQKAGPDTEPEDLENPAPRYGLVVISAHRYSADPAPMMSLHGR